MKLVLASNNAKKLSELQALFGGLGLELVSQSSLGVTEADEPFATFVENALAKARHAAAATGLAAIADDSGICVDALGGEPGVVSAHYAALPDAPGPALEREAHRRLQDAANNARLLQALAPGVDRRAHFVSTLVALRGPRDPQPLVAVGRWPGEVLVEPRGNTGFGYDPLMYIPTLGRSVAELDAATKNQYSHRALAAAQMVTLLRQVWRL